MTKQDWQKHIDEYKEQILRPSLGGDKKAWKTWYSIHAPGCAICKARAVTRKANREARHRNDLIRNICGTSAAAARRDGSV